MVHKNLRLQLTLKFKKDIQETVGVFNANFKRLLSRGNNKQFKTSEIQVNLKPGKPPENVSSYDSSISFESTMEKINY